MSEADRSLPAREARIYDSLAVAPTAAAYGVGPAWINGALYWSNGSTWAPANARGYRAPNSVYVLGDSFDARAMPSITANIYQTAHYAIFNITNLLLNNAFNVVGIDGVSGSGALAQPTVGQNYGVGTVRLNAALSSGAKYLYVRASTNDLNDVVQATAGQLISAYGGIFAAANAAGMTVLCSSISPGSYAATVAKRKAALLFNAWLEQKATQIYDVVALPMANALLDADSKEYAANTDAGWCSDGLHPDSVGAFAVASYHAGILRNVVGNQCSFVGETGTLGLNPTNIGITGAKGSGVSGDVADSMTLGQTSGTPTVVASKVARTDALGYWQRALWTPTGAGQLLEFVSTAITPNSDLAIGDIVSFCFEVSFSDSVTPADVRLTSGGAYFAGSTDAYHTVEGLRTSSTVGWGHSGWSGVAASPKVAIPAGTTGISPRVRVMSVNTNQIEVNFGRHWIINHSLFDRL
jgi:hypothetical protein